jgi:excisionase family DNA binding protein
MRRDSARQQADPLQLRKSLESPVVNQNSKEKPKSRLLRRKAAATYLGIGEKKVLLLIARGDLPYVQLGEGNSPFLIDVNDLDIWIAKHKTRANV